MDLADAWRRAIWSGCSKKAVPMIPAIKSTTVGCRRCDGITSTRHNAKDLEKQRNAAAHKVETSLQVCRDAININKKRKPTELKSALQDLHRCLREEGSLIDEDGAALYALTCAIEALRIAACKDESLDRRKRAFSTFAATLPEVQRRLAQQPGHVCDLQANVRRSVEERNARRPLGKLPPRQPALGEQPKLHSGKARRKSRTKTRRPYRDATLEGIHQTAQGLVLSAIENRRTIDGAFLETEPAFAKYFAELPGVLEQTHGQHADTIPTLDRLVMGLINSAAEEDDTERKALLQSGLEELCATLDTIALQLRKTETSFIERLSPFKRKK